MPYIANDEGKKFKDFTDWYKLAKENNYQHCILSDCIKLLPLSLLNDYVKGDENLDESIHRILPGNTPDFKNGIYPIKGCYYRVNTSQKDDVQKLEIIKKTNFILKVSKEVVNSSIKFGTEKEHKLEIYTIIGRRKTKPFIIGLNELFEFTKLPEALKRNGVHVSNLSSYDFKSVLEKEHRENSNILRVFENSGPVNVNNIDIWLYKNGCIDIQSGNTIYSDKKGYIKINDMTEILLDEPKGMKTPMLPNICEDMHDLIEKYPYLRDTQALYKNYFKKDSITLNNLLAASLLRNTLDAYNNTIEPFLLIGNAIMSPFAPEVNKKNRGFPLSYLYGEAQSGKSNILELIANIFGYDSTFLGGGSDTTKNILHNLEYYNCTPLLLQEVQANLKNTFEPTVKSIYDRTSRKIMTPYGKEQNIKSINGTMHFASNEIVPKNEQTMTRLVFMDLLKEKFDYRKAIPFNVIRDNLIALLLKDILFFKNNIEFINEKIDENISLIDEEEFQIESRSIKCNSLDKI